VSTFAYSNEYVKWSDLPDFMAAFFIAYGLILGLLAASATNQMSALMAYLFAGAFMGGIAYIIHLVHVLLAAP